MRALHWKLLLASLLMTAIFTASRMSGPETRPAAMFAQDSSVPSQSLLVAFEPPQPTDDDAAVPVLDFFEDFEGGPVHADAVDVPRPLPAEPITTSAPPAELPRVAEAQPIAPHTAAAAEELTQLLTQELSHLEAEQRRVWQDVLQGMSPREAAEIIQIWKATGGPLPSAAGPFGPLPTAIPATRAEPPEGSPDAVAFLQLNLQHLATPGYRRRLLLPHGATAATAGTRLDLSSGVVDVTHNPWHWAIEGTGFFLLQRGDQTVCTRNGEFDLSETREVIQRRPDGDWSLSPPIQLPADAVTLRLEPDGRVLAERSVGQSPIECGRVQLATCLNPQYMDTFHADLLQATSRSGPLVPCHAGSTLVGTLLQARLERSNVTLETESLDLDRAVRVEQLQQRAAQLDEPTPAR